MRSLVGGGSVERQAAQQQQKQQERGLRVTRFHVCGVKTPQRRRKRGLWSRLGVARVGFLGCFVWEHLVETVEGTTSPAEVWWQDVGEEGGGERRWKGAVDVERGAR